MQIILWAGRQWRMSFITNIDNSGAHPLIKTFALLEMAWYIAIKHHA